MQPLPIYNEVEVKKPPSKSEIRRQLEQQVVDYIDQGGKVDEIGRGISGVDTGEPIGAMRSRFNFSPKIERTFVPEVIAAIDARKSQPKTKLPAKKPAKPHKEIIYDDFGEPLRWKWVEE